MKKTAKALTLLLIAALLSAAAFAADIPEATSDFFVNDYADVLSPETEQHIMDVSVPLAEETGAQVVVLTLESLEGMDIESYGLEVGRQWGIGDNDKDNGLLILLSVGDREIRLEVGYGLEGAINDAKAGRLIRDYAQDYYANDEFDEGTRELYNAAVSLVREEYGLEPMEGYEAAGAEEEVTSFEDFTASDWFFFVMFMLIFLRFFVIAAIISIINFFRGIFGFSPIGGGCLLGSGGGGDGNYHGGGWSSGGGGGFSGGGGSFGGGGASGKF